MLKKRLIPILLLKSGFLVRSEYFSVHQIIGNPLHEVERFNQWRVDELIYLDITSNNQYITSRQDIKLKSDSKPYAILKQISDYCFMPLTWGGNIRSINDMENAFMNGADKIAINSLIFTKPKIIDEAANIFGSQAIVASIDVLEKPNGLYEVYSDGGSKPTGYTPTEIAKTVESLGAGEILVQSIDRDGKGSGYDLNLIQMVADAVNIPVIACSGVGDYTHFAKGIKAGASAVAAANIWHFKELVDRNAKISMKKEGIDVRL